MFEDSFRNIHKVSLIFCNNMCRAQLDQEKAEYEKKIAAIESNLITLKARVDSDSEIIKKLRIELEKKQYITLSLVIN